jgi:hypothetical protein
VPAEASSISESRPNPSSATDPASNAATIATPASTVIQPMLNSESVLARRTNSERVFPASSRTRTEEVCELTPTRYRGSESACPVGQIELLGDIELARRHAGLWREESIFGSTEPNVNGLKTAPEDWRENWRTRRVFWL